MPLTDWVRCQLLLLPLEYVRSLVPVFWSLFLSQQTSSVRCTRSSGDSSSLVHQGMSRPPRSCLPCRIVHAKCSPSIDPSICEPCAKSQSACTSIPSGKWSTLVSCPAHFIPSFKRPSPFFSSFSGGAFCSPSIYIWCWCSLFIHVAPVA